MKLSLCIPTFNEEKVVHYPLDSAYDMADEVVVIDGTSEDRTVETAKSYGKKIKVFIVNNPPNFLQNKQRAIDKAQGEWVLQLDADEALSPELKEEILSVILSDSEGSLANASINSNKFVGYYIPRKNWFLNRFLMKGGVYPDYVLRLYKKDKAHFALKDLHENVKIEGEVGYLKNAILHYADPDFSRYLKRWDRYTTFDAVELYQKLKIQNSKFKIFLAGLNYFLIKPPVWFLKTYFRHKGFMDGFPGFVFSFFSALRFCTIYIKAWHLKNVDKSPKQ